MFSMWKGVIKGKFQAFLIHSENDKIKTCFDLLDMIQTRHTFTTMMISSGENLGWVQKIMGHGLLKMRFIRLMSTAKLNRNKDGR